MFADCKMCARVELTLERKLRLGDGGKCYGITEILIVPIYNDWTNPSEPENITKDRVERIERDM